MMIALWAIALNFEITVNEPELVNLWQYDANGAICLSSEEENNKSDTTEEEEEPDCD